MKILFIGARLFDDVSFFLKEKGIYSILTESNPNSDNLDLADEVHIVSRGMDEPKKIAIENNVDAVIPLIGIDPPLMDVAILKEDLEKNHNIPVICSNTSAIDISSSKFKTKEFFNSIGVKTPKSFIFTNNKTYDFNITKNKIEFNLNGEILSFNLPIVLKQKEGQGGSDIKIAKNSDDFKEYIENFNKTLVEEFIEGSEISVEVLSFNEKYFPLVPVYKGETSLDGFHPIKRVRSAPFKINDFNNPINSSNLNNSKHFEDLNHSKLDFVMDISLLIAKNLKSDGTIDIDFIYSKKDNLFYAIEVNTRPSGTRYLSYASTGISPLIQLVKMASNDFNIENLNDERKDYYSLEIPVGNFNGELLDKPLKKFIKNSWVVHGPKNYERITFSGENKKIVYDLAKKLLKNRDLSLDF